MGYKKHFVGRGWSLIGGLEKFQNKRFGKKGWEKKWKEGFDHQRNYVVKLGSHQILPSKTDEPTNQVRKSPQKVFRKTAIQKNVTEFQAKYRQYSLFHFSEISLQLSLNLFKGCLPQILLGLFLNTLTHICLSKLLFYFRFSFHQ